MRIKKKYLVALMALILVVSMGISYNITISQARDNKKEESGTYSEEIKNKVLYNSKRNPFDINGSVNGIQLIRLNLKKDVTKKNQKKKIKKHKKKKPQNNQLIKFRKKLANMGVADLSMYEDETIAIYAKPKKGSNVVGYLADGSTMKIVKAIPRIIKKKVKVKNPVNKADEKKNSKKNKKNNKNNKKNKPAYKVVTKNIIVKNWYKIKSGNITGYVKTKDIIVGKKVEKILLDNKNISASFNKGNVPITGSPKKGGVAIGMGYVGGEYPIIEYSKKLRFVKIQRTETIAGWVPVDKITIKSSGPAAMTKQEYEAYQEELRIKEEQALQSYLKIQINSTGNKLQDSIIKMIAHNESGNYRAARNPKIGAERTITVGAWQWYGERAHNILRLICGANVAKSKKIINASFTGKKAKEKAEKLYKDIINHSNWEGEKRVFTKSEIIAIKELLGSDYGVKVQNEKIREDIQIRISSAIRSYKLTNNKLTAYYCDLFWQSPNNARRIMSACIKHYKSAKKFCEAKDGLEYFHKTAMKNGVMRKYSNRRNYTYAICKTIK